MKTTKLKLLLSLFLVMTLTSACNSISGLTKPSSSTIATDQPAPQMAMLASPESSSRISTGKISNDSLNREEKKLIKRANIQLEVKDLDNASEELSALLDNYNGHISSSREWEDHNQRKHYHYTLRIPQDNFDTTLAELRDLGKVKSKEISGEDITREYVDIQARLRNFKHQEERYLELLDEAEKVEDILKVENELNRIRRSIEQLEGQIRFYDNRVDMSKINLNISPPQPIINDGLGSGLLNSFKYSVDGFIRSIHLIIIFIGFIIPWLLLTVVIGTIIYKILKKRRK
ncbi:DUF4349 domain-containing protein [Halonatronum saccharophilum]|uniref:DUF4349 domain-containing protein n=1 Tax=Halonatronum saccharophilum TaxID=150060 RepID=UPI0004B4094B|nr:DUF4349 domain-containing protein [Halonatronum saccharophilum]